MPRTTIPPAEPAGLDPEVLYTLGGFYRASGQNPTSVYLARRDGIELRTVDCGRRKYVRGRDGIEFILQRADHEAAKARAAS